MNEMEGEILGMGHRPGPGGGIVVRCDECRNVMVIPLPVDQPLKTCECGYAWVIKARGEKE